LIRGKHKPIFDIQRTDFIGDKVVIVNAGNILMTGRKRQQKIYYHHTRRAGGLFAIPF